MDLSKIYLSNGELRSLRIVRHRGLIPKSHAEYLRRCRLIEPDYRVQLFALCRCRITRCGVRYIDCENRRRYERIWSRGLSILAIVVSAVTAVISATR